MKFITQLGFSGTADAAIELYKEAFGMTVKRCSITATRQSSAGQNPAKRRMTQI